MLSCPGAPTLISISWRHSCDDSHNVSVYYAAATTSQPAHCARCRKTARDAILLSIGGILVLTLVCAALRLAYRHCLTAAHKDQLRSAWMLFTPHNKLKICIGFYQIITKIDTVYEVELPPEVRRMLNVFSTGVSFGLSGTSAVLECLGLRGYMATLTLYIVTPLLIAAAIFVISACTMRFAKSGSEASPAKARESRLQASKHHALALFEKALPPLLQLAFLTYPIVATKAFEAFSCYQFTASRWLKADVAIRCHSDEHVDTKGLAAIAIFLYPIGAPCCGIKKPKTARIHFAPRSAGQVFCSIWQVSSSSTPCFYIVLVTRSAPISPRPSARPSGFCIASSSRTSSGGSWSRCCAALCSSG